MNYQILNNTVLDYLITLAILSVGFFAVTMLRVLMLGRLQRKAERTNRKLDDFFFKLLKNTLIPSLYYGVFYLSLMHLSLNETLTSAIRFLGVVILTMLGISFFINLINYLIVHHWLEKTGDESAQRSVRSIMPIIKVVVYGIAIFFLLDNLGFKVSTLLAGLGIGGVAVALGGQAILGDLFSYFAILFDRPFEIGDFVVIDQFQGNIEHIGIKTTRVRSLGGELLVFSNKDITNSRVRNFKHMVERRVLFKLGVVHQTNGSHLRELPQILKTAIEKIEHAKFDRAHFAAIGNCSLDFEIVYYIMSGDYSKYMDVQQEVNLKICEELQKRKIDLAYPTQTLFVNK